MSTPIIDFVYYLSPCLYIIKYNQTQINDVTNVTTLKSVKIYSIGLLLYNFVKKCPNNSQNEYKYTAIFEQLVICILLV